MTDRIYKFGEFELAAGEGELRTRDSCVRLQEKPLQLLLLLVENPQQVVTRSQLRERMWDTATFVDYEQGINIAVKKVRDALGDSAANPRIIQTIARKGYRFLVSVEVSFSEVEAPAVPPPEPAAASAEPLRAAPPRGRAVRRPWIFAAFALAALFAAGLWFFENRTQPHPPPRIRSLAVLPLRNLSPDSGQDYFADGVTEELITSLAQTLPLRVISRTSVMRYRQTSEPIGQIARELGVDAIVEGAVARSGDRVMVTVQLIDAAEDRHLWARKYDRKLEDFLAIEADLSQEIAGQIGGALSSEPGVEAANPPVKSPAKPPVDPQVYELCLMGRYHWNKRTAADLARSAEYYRQAIARDPNYAPAYAGLANAYALMPSYDSVAMRDGLTKAAAAARHALALDNTLAEAHAVLGFIGLNSPDWTLAEPEFRRALKLNPNYATAHHWFAFYLLFAGRDAESLAQMELARQLDPLSAILNADEGHFLYVERRYQEAEARLRQAIELAPDFGQPHETLALIDLETGRASDALREARAGLALAPTNPRAMGEAGYVLARTGQDKEAGKLLSTLKEMARRGSDYPFSAFIQVGLGQRNEALDSLKILAHSDMYASFVALGQWHFLDELKADPRYRKLLAQAREKSISSSRQF